VLSKGHWLLLRCGDPSATSPCQGNTGLAADPFNMCAGTAGGGPGWGGFGVGW
jgi:hypothetical protein